MKTSLHKPVALLVLGILLLCAAMLPTFGPVGAAPPVVEPAQDVPGDGILRIPAGNPPEALDGDCSDFTDATAQPYADSGGGGTVYLKHDGKDLYVCIEARPGSFAERFFSVYLDPQGNGAGYEFAAADDYSLRVGIPGTTRTSLVGSGVANGYVARPDADPLWDAAASATPNGETGEYRISLGRFFLAPCRIFGLAAYHHWLKAVGDDYGWPSNQYFDQPRTWAQVQLEPADGCPAELGTIAYVYRGDAAAAISFFNLLAANGYAVTLVPLANVLSTDFNQFDLTIIADDSGNLDSWGIAADTAAQWPTITAPNKPILGLG
ncbi:MAG: hypothetical protein HC822_27195, partial [Oscillochloris sp.]|nr:hypothetical protein [Oscillochloris sp.]